MKRGRTRVRFAGAGLFFGPALFLGSFLVPPVAAAAAVQAGSDLPTWDELMRRAQEQTINGQYADAASGADAAVERAAASFGIMHIKVAQALNVAARAAWRLGRLPQSEALLKRARMIGEQERDENPHVLGETLTLLGGVYRDEGRFNEATAAAQEGLDLRRQAFGSEDPSVAESLELVAGLAVERGRPDEAEPILREAVGIQRRSLSSFAAADRSRAKRAGTPSPGLHEAPFIAAKSARAARKGGSFVSVEDSARLSSPPLEAARSLDALAKLYIAQGRFSEAQPLADEAKTLVTEAVGPAHPQTAEVLGTLGELARNAGVYDEAERLAEENLRVSEHALGAQHPRIAEALGALARVKRAKGQYAAAEQAYQRALSVGERSLGHEHPEVGKLLADLAGLFVLEDKRVEAAGCFERSLAILERAYGPDHPVVARVAYAYLPLREATGYGDMDPESRRYQRILALAAESLNRRAGIYRSLGEYGAAEELFKQALEMTERAFGPEHKDVGVILENYAVVLHKMGRPREAEKLQARAAKIRAQQGL